jgi:hypothetical protein
LFPSGAGLLIPVSTVFAARLVIDVALARQGFYYGDDPDTFWRLGLSWQWAQKPFLALGHWLPLQFWLAGLTFRALAPFHVAATPVVLVIWNHMFFGGSLTVLYLLVRRRSGELAAVASIALACAMTTDIWTTFSGLAEPLLVFAGLTITLAVARYIDQQGDPEIGLLYLMAAAGAVAAAAHYAGWFLVAFAIAFLAFVVLRSLRSRGARQRELSPAVKSGLILLAVPTGWLLLNELRFGDPFRFITTAPHYQQWPSEALLTRAASGLGALWEAEPGMVLALVASLPLVAVTDRRALLPLLPAAIHVALLSFCGLGPYGVLHPRHSLVSTWFLIPVIGSAIGTLGRGRSSITVPCALGVVAVLAVDGIDRSFGFRNWMDIEAQRVVGLVDGQIREADRPMSILIERQNCLFPGPGIANSLSRPDWATLLDTDQVSRLASDDPSSLRTYDLIILTNPLTVRVLSGSAHAVAELGDYMILSPGYSPSSEDITLPSPWQPITDSEFLAVNDEGTVHFAFTSSPRHVMDAVGIQASIPTSPGSCYILSADVQDWVEQSEPRWAVLQQLIANGVVIWSHDVAEGPGCWQRLDHYLVATSNTLDIELAAVAPSGSVPSVDWPAMSLTGIRGLRIAECP